MKKKWDEKKLGDLLVITETTDPTRSPNDYFDYIDVSSVSNETLTIQETQRLQGKNAPSRARRLVRANDVLFATIRPTLRRIAIVPEQLDKQVCSTGYFVLRAKPDVDFRFIYYFLQTEDFMAAMENLQKGASYPAVTDGDVRSQSVPVPALCEQQRIVGVLSEAFAGLAIAKANIEKNLQNVHALFESHLQFVFTHPGKGWLEMTLEKATGGVFTGPFGSLLHKSDYVENHIPLVNPSHITETGIEPDNSKTVTRQTAKRLGSYIMHEGDIVIGRRGEMGRCAVITDVEDGWLCGTGSFFIKPSQHCDPRFLVYVLRSASCRAKLEDLAGGAVMPNLSNTALAGLVINLPPVLQQRALVAELDSLADETQRLTRLYERKLAALVELKKSLLHQAFNGEL